MSRTLPARRSRVFAALTEPEDLARWFGPNGFTARSVDVDLRVGGAYRIAMQPPQGELFYLGGEFREVEPPAHLSYTFCYEDPDPEDQETIVTLSLEDLGDATELEFSQREFATERRRALHDEGWANSLDRLHEMLSSRASVDSARFRLNGAAQESNLPSVGLPRLTGFEGLRTQAHLGTGAGFTARSDPLRCAEVR